MLLIHHKAFNLYNRELRVEVNEDVEVRLHGVLQIWGDSQFAEVYMVHDTIKQDVMVDNKILTNAKCTANPLKFAGPFSKYRT